MVRKRDTRALMLPGGNIEPEEMPIEALRRELLEELHLQLNDSALTSFGQIQAPAANEADSQIGTYLYLAHLRHSVTAAAELKRCAGTHFSSPTLPTRPHCCACMSGRDYVAERDYAATNAQCRLVQPGR